MNNQSLSEYQRDIFYCLIEQRRFLSCLKISEIKYFIKIFKQELKSRRKIIE